MNKIGLVIQREYLSRVKKKSFLLTTILVPIIIIGFYAAIIAISISDSGDKVKVAVVDQQGLFGGNIEKAKNDPSDYVLISGETEQSYKSKYKDKGYDYFLFIPKIDITQPKGIKLHSPSAISLGVKNKIENTVDKIIEEQRLKAANINAEQYRAINSDISIDNTIDSGDKEKKSVAGVAYAVSFACGILIYMILLIYGTMVMRGVMEEKTSRIAEVVISSVKPFQLMMGKIIGIGAVGITQFLIWILLMLVLQTILPAIFPALSQQMTDQSAVTGAAAAGPNMFATVTEGLRSLPIGLILFCFLFYFIGGYLLYASMFAAIGSVVSEDQQEAQQLVFPVMMPIILSFVIMVKAIDEPNSSLAIFGSLFPLTSPIVMMGRITYEVPWWQLVTSMALLVLGFIFFTWLTAKIYRTGILLYGKRVTWKEMLKWAFRKA
ncbi:MAG TPA: ABC transporter permease [Flavitalea sp.]|nr:ABC transporter permease [Flavitalea sp.]